MRAALRLGAGIEERISCRLAIRFDYSYTYYGRVVRVAVQVRQLTQSLVVQELSSSMVLLMQK